MSKKRGDSRWKRSERRCLGYSTGRKTSSLRDSDASDYIYQLKELEKLGPRKGVITQSVKDVVQSLVDDDLVSKDKIGTSLRNVYPKLESDVQSSKRRLTELADQCNALKKGREESDEREEALSNLKKVEKHNELQDEMAKYADNDPAAFETMT